MLVLISNQMISCLCWTLPMGFSSLISSRLRLKQSRKQFAHFFPARSKKKISLTLPTAHEPARDRVRLAAPNLPALVVSLQVPHAAPPPALRRGPLRAQLGGVGRVGAASARKVQEILFILHVAARLFILIAALACGEMLGVVAPCRERL
jgi:hypothetical protein